MQTLEHGMCGADRCGQLRWTCVKFLNKSFRDSYWMWYERCKRGSGAD